VPRPPRPDCTPFPSNPQTRYTKGHTGRPTYLVIYSATAVREYRGFICPSF